MPGQLQFQMSANSRFVLQRLRDAKIGELVTYDELSALIGGSVHSLKIPIATARRVLLREENFVFGVVIGTGLQRLTDRQIVGTSSATAQKVRRAARRGVRVLTAVQDFSALPREDQMRHSASVSILGAVAEMTTEKAILKVEKTVANGKDLPFMQTLDAFRT